MDVITVLEELEIPHLQSGHEHCRPGWVQIDCPYCSPGWGHWRMGINLEYPAANCWHCGPKNLVKAILDSTPDRSRAYSLLKETRFRRVGRSETNGNRPGRVKPPAGIKPLSQAHREYLRKRGFDPSYIESEWGVKGIGLQKKLAWRLWIPIHRNGLLVSWTTRSISTKRSKMRYISCPKDQEVFHHKHLLYGADKAMNTIIVVEGPMDAWRIGPGAVATFGTSVTNEQMLAISKFPVRIICFDKGTERITNDLVQQIQSMSPGDTYSMELETGDDPCDASEEEIKAIRRML